MFVSRNPNLGKDDIKNLVISWSQFCRETLPDRTFTFWEWFYRVMNLTALHMRGNQGGGGFSVPTRVLENRLDLFRYEGPRSVQI